MELRHLRYFVGAGEEERCELACNHRFGFSIALLSNLEERECVALAAQFFSARTSDSGGSYFGLKAIR
jgi:hypothetical protein